MKKIVSVMMLLLVMVSLHAGNGLLWKVSGNGLEKPSYILGSHHAAPAEFVDSIPGLQEAMGEVTAVYGEVAKDALTGPEAQQMMMVYAMAPADSTLSRLLSPQDMAQLDSLFAHYTGMSGVVAQMEMLKPAIVSTQLSMLQLSAACPQIQVLQPFDAVVMTLGEAQGKEIGGLESLESQMKLLFGTPLTIQAEDLMDAVRNNDSLIRQAAELTNSYLSRDLDAVTRITTDPEYGIEPENLDRLLYDRNRDWARQLVSLLPEKSMLVVVGAGHLGGNQGLLNLLKNNGYTVEPVN